MTPKNIIAIRGQSVHCPFTLIIQYNLSHRKNLDPNQVLWLDEFFEK